MRTPAGSRAASDPILRVTAAQWGAWLAEHHASSTGVRVLLTRRGGGEGYCRLTRWALPTLQRFGVSDLDIECMMERNPARLLASV